MRIAIPAEIDAGEPRVAATPETVKKLIGLGPASRWLRVRVRVRHSDAEYAAAGATVAPTGSGRPTSC